MIACCTYRCCVFRYFALLLLAGGLPTFSLATAPSLDTLAGVLDLRDQALSARPIGLTTHWEFYWKQFYTPSEFSTRTLVPSRYMKLPNDWTGFKVDGTPLPGQGYATYRLRVLLPHHREDLALDIPTVSSAVDLWVDGNLLYQAGETGTRYAASQPSYAPTYITFTPTRDTLEIIMHVANFHHRKGGAWQTFYLGTASVVAREWLTRQGAQLFLIGCIFIMGIYHVVFYLFRKKELAPLFLGLFCLTVVMRVLATGQCLILYILPVSWEWLVRMEVWGFYLTIPLFASFFYNTFPQITSRLVIQFSWVVAIGFSLVVLLTPPITFTYTIVSYQFISLLLSIYGLFLVARAALLRLPGSKAFVIGFSALFLTLVNDILHSSNIINTTYMASFGLLVFILAHAFSLSRYFAQAFVTLQKVNATLSDSNAKVNEQNEELKRVNGELDVFVYRTSHDLRAPIASTLGLINLMRLDNDPTQTVRYLDLQENALTKLDNFIQDILDYSRNARLDLEPEPIDFRRILDETFSLYTHLEHYDQINQIIDIQQSVEFFSDAKRLTIIFNNLLSNAIRYVRPTAEGSFIKITIRVDAQHAQVEVSDNGQGIAEEHRDKVFDMFYRASLNTKGSGLGLFIVKEMITKMEGTIRINSEVNQGTQFTWTVPNMGAKLST